MARETLEVNPEKQACAPDGEFVGGILMIQVRVAVAGHDAMARHKVGRARGPRRHRARRDHVADEFVVGDIQLQHLVDVVMEAVDPLAKLFVVAEHVAEEGRPAVQVRPHARGPPADAHRRQLGEQCLNMLVALVGGFVGEKGGDNFRSGQAAAEIECHAAQELFVGGAGCGGHAVALHLAEDMIVDQVPALRGGQ